MVKRMLSVEELIIVCEKIYKQLRLKKVKSRHVDILLGFYCIPELASESGFLKCLGRYEPVGIRLEKTAIKWKSRPRN